ncbi:MAG: hypothetical protein AMXMBFR81_05600 [Chthonomonas sp.]
MNALALALCLSAQPAPAALNGMDPVELAAGREVRGSDSLAATDGRYHYWFATEANRSTFAADPLRFGIQMGGACGRMGPLTGRGNMHRYFVHEGKIFIFASEQCRDSFKKDPSAHVERTDAVPKGSAEAKRRGLAMLDRAAIAHGGQAVDEFQSLLWTTQETYNVEGKPEIYVSGYAMQWPDRFATQSRWQTSLITSNASGAGGWEGDKASARPIHPDEHAFLRRVFYHHPLIVLRLRKQPGFVAVPGSGMLGGEALPTVAAHYGGATTTLYLHPATFKILGVAYTARRSSYVPIVRQYTDYATVRGVLTPMAWTDTVESSGAKVPAKLAKVELNLRLDAAGFGDPRKAADLLGTPVGS